MVCYIHGIASFHRCRSKGTRSPPGHIATLGTRRKDRASERTAGGRRRFLDENERHYAYACLASYSALGVIMEGGTPDLKPGSLMKKRRRVIVCYLHRILRKALNNTWPTVHLVRSMALDETLYASVIIERPDKTPRSVQMMLVSSTATAMVKYSPRQLSNATIQAEPEESCGHSQGI